MSQLVDIAWRVVCWMNRLIFWLKLCADYLGCKLSWDLSSGHNKLSIEFAQLPVAWEIGWAFVDAREKMGMDCRATDCLSFSFILCFISRAGCLEEDGYGWRSSHLSHCHRRHSVEPIKWPEVSLFKYKVESYYHKKVQNYCLRCAPENGDSPQSDQAGWQRVKGVEGSWGGELELEGGDTGGGRWKPPGEREAPPPPWQGC